MANCCDRIRDYQFNLFNLFIDFHQFDVNTEGKSFTFSSTDGNGDF